MLPTYSDYSLHKANVIQTCGFFYKSNYILVTRSDYYQLDLIEIKDSKNSDVIWY